MLKTSSRLVHLPYPRVLSGAAILTAKSLWIGIPTHATPRVTGTWGRGAARIKGPRDCQAELIVQGLGEGEESLDLDLKNGEARENK